MSDPFEFSELFENERVFSKFPNLRIENSPAFYVLLRCIVGNIKIKQTFRDITFEQTRNYLNYLAPNKASSVVKSGEDREKKVVTPEIKTEIQIVLEILKFNGVSDIEHLIKYISDSFTLKDLSDILSDRRMKFKNKVFFESLNYEFGNFYYHTAKENHTIAFIHLYRILEYISYTFPIMYASKTGDYSKSFDTLKSLFSGDKDQGELKVFKNFIRSVIGVEKNYERLSIEIDIVSDFEEFNKRMYDTIMAICENSMFDEGRNIPNSRISIKFTEFSSFVITIRNRFFHLKNSQDNNIRSVDIIDSDYFFGLINGKCAYYLSLLTFEVVKNSILQK